MNTVVIAMLAFALGALVGRELERHYMKNNKKERK
jgi:hypothetical protein